jgi:hypothetical protein
MVKDTLPPRFRGRPSFTLCRRELLSSKTPSTLLNVDMKNSAESEKQHATVVTALTAKNSLAEQLGRVDRRTQGSRRKLAVTVDQIESLSE